MFPNTLPTIASAILAAATPAFSTTEQPDYFSIGDLAGLCKGIDAGLSTDNHLMCVTYISGFDAGYSAAVGVGGAKKLFCFPDQVSQEQRALVFLKWSENNPEQLHQIAEVGLFISFAKAFPCPTTSAS